jgi:hypothetical protein
MVIERMRIAVISVGVFAALVLVAASPALAQRSGGSGGPAGGGRAVPRPTHVVGGPVRGPGPSRVSGPVYVGPRGGYYSYGRYPYGYRYGYPGYAYGGYYRYPYYAFTPHFSIGVGFSVGYPVAYPYAYAGSPYYGAYYGYPYYAYPPAYPPYAVYPPSSPPPATSYPSQPSTSIQARPGSSAVGGLSFDLTPSNAAVFIDGVYVGPVSSFSPTEAPLNLSTGKHHVEVRAQGYESMSFDADVTSGQVVPYRGSLQPIK